MQRFSSFLRLIDRDVSSVSIGGIVTPQKVSTGCEKGVIIMKKMVNRYKISKFKRFMNGMIFALISIIALILCMSDISRYTATQSEVILPFFIAIVSMLMGLFTTLHDKGIRKEKTQ